MLSGSGNFLLKTVQCMNQLSTGLEIGLPFGRQRQLAGRAVDKTHAEPSLQTCNELGNCRRRKPQIASGTGEGATLDRPHEHAHFGKLIDAAVLRFNHASTPCPRCFADCRPHHLPPASVGGPSVPSKTRGTRAPSGPSVFPAGTGHKPAFAPDGAAP